MIYFVGDTVELAGKTYEVRHDDFYRTPAGKVPIFHAPYVLPRYVEPAELRLVHRPWFNHLKALLT